MTHEFYPLVCNHSLKSYTEHKCFMLMVTENWPGQPAASGQLMKEAAAFTCL